MAPSRPLPDLLYFPSLFLLLLLALTHQACGIRCVQCEAEGTQDECFVKPPPPIECGRGMNVCLTIHTYTPDREDSRKMLSLVRTCAPTDMGWDCERGRTKGGHQMEVCHDTCTWDGCNHARSTAASALVVVTTALLTNVLLL
ncbi:uncharacterized protein LOC123505519 [Portunus trituberculatus]|uniref:uncharacterized protein LOC123505519 n=1 Tax=Portunus trituberculatus TaxID=210409 RepID=UPI001E1CE0EC|nr:uncharacterized protein LOC123505519 [Portunus trituberculatus]XP_045112841.1 uncharacterized protein LOC123505519 [Portunus trituberculatus]XP_045112842.1 uncharacterized protein LOC123505519 [Portunus trituberculatus]XP_045112843.1 uncharacterized protein LOC123505519 [Portunus trituberculatus]